MDFMLGSGLDGSKSTSLQGIVTDVLPVGVFANGKKTSDQQKGHLIVCF